MNFKLHDHKILDTLDPNIDHKAKGIDKNNLKFSTSLNGKPSMKIDEQFNIECNQIIIHVDIENGSTNKKMDEITINFGYTIFDLVSSFDKTVNSLLEDLKNRIRKDLKKITKNSHLNIINYDSLKLNINNFNEYVIPALENLNIKTIELKQGSNDIYGDVKVVKQFRILKIVPESRLYLNSHPEGENDGQIINIGQKINVQYPIYIYKQSKSYQNIAIKLIK